MDGSSPFGPRGNQVLIAAATTAPDGVQIGGATGGEVSILVYNPGLYSVNLGFGPNAATAKANTALPTGVGANSTASLPVPPSSLQTITMSAGLFYSGLATGGAQNIYLTPGAGS